VSTGSARRPGAAGGPASLLADVLATLLHLPTVCAVAAVSVVLCTPSLLPLPGLQPGALASAVFQVAGTMVALALPAAEMSNTMIGDAEKKLALLVDSDIATRVDVEARLAASRQLTADLREHLVPAWRSAVYAFASLLCSAAALLAASVSASADAVSVQRDPAAVLAVVSLVCLVAAAAWVYPTVQYVFRLRFIDRLADLSQLVIRAAPPPNGDEPH
jgi:hypothetical protein